MFYFGGMTLGYLTPPAPVAKGDQGNKMANEANTAAGPVAKPDRIPTLKDLVARANWLSFLS